MSKILVSGSIAYDRIMDFPGRFKDHILPNKIHILNVCFNVGTLKESFGGTAGNIAYNLSLLQEKPIVLGIAGKDFSRYEQWLKAKRVDTNLIKKDDQCLTSSAFIVTDQDDNQLGSFYGTGADIQYCRRMIQRVKKVDLAIVSPENYKNMLAYAILYQQQGIPYIFDPGQVLPDFSAAAIKKAVQGAKVLIGNDYEIQLILNKLKIKQPQLEKMVEILVITKGAKGSEIYQQGRKIKIPPAKPRNTCDPTGAGDAYRAGLIKGLVEDWPLEKVGRLAGLVAVYTVEKYGTQTHRFTWPELAKRYYQNFKEKL
jgi:adenosine kinase